MANKTNGVLILVQDILRMFNEPYEEDVIEDVFLAIESNPEWLRRYKELLDELSKEVVNPWVGRYTKRLTGLNSLREVVAKRSKLITGYTNLIR